MILSFPSLIQPFEIGKRLPKGEPIHYAHSIGSSFGFVFTPPVDLKPNDHVWIDVRNGRVEIVERGGIAIYRSGWKN
jgi:hypothetical protein